MSLVELRRNSLPHVGAPLTAPVFRKSSHPARILQNNNNNFLGSHEPPKPVFTIEEQRRMSKDDLSVPSERIHPRTCSSEVGQRRITHSEDMNNMVRSITQEAKSLLHAETCSLFLVDQESKELVAEVFDQADNLSEIRLPMDQGIVGRVASTGLMMNVKNVLRCPFFCSVIDEMTGFRTRNILCFPIVDNSGAFVGVAELCNKIGKQQGFSRHDESIARTFAVYAATSISHCLLYRKVQEAQRRSHMAAELLIQGSPLLVSSEDVARMASMPIAPVESFHKRFTCFSFFPRIIGDGDKYVQASMSMFQDLGFISRFRIRRDQLAHFLLRVSRGYRDVPYHNWSHGFSVAHFGFLLLRTSSVKRALGELEQFSLLISCICHDIDHRGTNNDFQIKSNTPLAQLYSSEGSIMERHHYAQTASILGMEECNILQSLTGTQYGQVLRHIRDIILATDVVVHMSKVKSLRAMIKNGYDSADVEQRNLFVGLLMTGSDLSDQSKDFQSSKGVAENVYQEFFTQGDLQKQMDHRDIPEMMDRNRAHVPTIQLQFMDNVAMPVFEMISNLVPETMTTWHTTQLNRRYWESLADIFRERDEPVLGLEFLHDKQLENEVIERVNGKNHTHPDGDINFVPISTSTPRKS